MELKLRGYPEFMTQKWQIIDIYEGYVLSYDEIDDDEGFTKHWYQATSNKGECVFEQELQHFTYQSNHTFVIDEFRRLVYSDLK
jgi:hypothetical protein